MKQSIKKIFSNLNIYLVFIIILSSFVVLFTLEHKLSIKKTDNLNQQKLILSDLTHLRVADIELVLIKFNAQSHMLLSDIQKLRTLYKYSFVQQTLINNSQEYLTDLLKLTRLTKEFNKQVGTYYIQYTEKLSPLEKEKLERTDLKESFYLLNEHINSIIFKEIAYNKQIFAFIEKLSLLSFLIILGMTFFFRKKLKLIYQDILFLYSIGKNKKDYEIYSEEVDAISLRMSRKSLTVDNPSMTDNVTGINNYKGMINSYSQKKNTKDHNITSITVFEVDNFSQTNKRYPDQTLQSILKKIAYTISLYEHPLDIISRSDYNQFTLILSRSSKELALKDIEMIRQSIDELRFPTPNEEKIHVTLSGGFMIKHSNMPLNESLKISLDALLHAKNSGGNRISNEKDIR